MLPHRARKLISEFSKPITRPDWRSGTPLAKLITESPIMVYINKTIKHQLMIEINGTVYSLDRLKLKFNKILEYSGNYIHMYGEELLIYTHPYLYYPSYANFYLYAKYYLKNTGHLILSNVLNRYEYKYLKN